MCGVREVDAEWRRGSWWAVVGGVELLQMWRWWGEGGGGGDVG